MHLQNESCVSSLYKADISGDFHQVIMMLWCILVRFGVWRFGYSVMSFYVLIMSVSFFCFFLLLYLIEEFLATEISTNTKMSVTISETCAL